ncbi:hypothetical protein LTR08_006254 [Meristemomyces frigidus]|nr:hypothetical protein LTR08_006254 [Meristemomyces frigidus]
MSVRYPGVPALQGRGGGAASGSRQLQQTHALEVDGGAYGRLAAMDSMAGSTVDYAMLGEVDGAGMLTGLDMDVDNLLPMDLDMSDSSFSPQDHQHVSHHHGPAALLHDPSLVGNADFAATAPLDGQSHVDGVPDGGAGAGPLPTGFGIPAQTASSTLTEFTKRRNWSQRIIEELKDFLHILTPDGRILYVSPSCKAITGYDAQLLVGKFIGEYVHPDDSGIFMREFNESIASGNSLRFYYRFKKEDGTYMIFECDGHPHISHDPGSQNHNDDSGNGTPRPGVCRGFFMMARPYPTKNAALLDSFLEHKIENERLMKRIEELKREEVEEDTEHERTIQDGAPLSQSGATLSESPQIQTMRPFGNSTPSEMISAMTPNYQGMPPPAKPTISNNALTRQNLDSALSAQRPDSIADKMHRYEAHATTHLESIELLTGLRYRDGERSHGISTGDTSPALIRGDAGIAILLDRDREGGKKEKKKLKVADEYVCADCGTLDSPEWRKGPKGPKTLCNACGLRWAKKEKKRGGDDGGGVSNSPGGLTMGLSAGPSPQQAQSYGGGVVGGQPPGLPMQTSPGSS